MTAQNTKTIHPAAINVLAEARLGQYTVQVYNYGDLWLPGLPPADIDELVYRVLLGGFPVQSLPGFTTIEEFIPVEVATLGHGLVKLLRTGGFVNPMSPSLLYYDPMTQIIEFSLSEMQAAAGNYIRLLDFIKVKAAAYGGDQAIRIVFINPAELEPKEHLFLYRQIDAVEHASFWIAHQNEVGEIWTPLNMMKDVFLPYQTSSGTIDFHDLFSVFFALGRALLEKQRGLDGSSDLLAQADEMEGNQ